MSLLHPVGQGITVMGMNVITQNALPPEMCGTPKLPGMAPSEPHDWLRVDEAYAAQMQHRQYLLKSRECDVLWLDPSAQQAAEEVLAQALTVLPLLGFAVESESVMCPDGRRVPLDIAKPLHTLGQLVQEDICIMRKQGDAHLLVGAVLCFPASWRLAEKVGKPLIGIHAPVEEYDDLLAKRVQRLFDAVRIGRPLWRFNKLWYDDAELFQPRSAETATRRILPDQDAAPFIRSERQCLVRMPLSDVVVFSIHTYVVRT